jgi:2-dehydro-3-deoxyphosphogluconate aldolase/(4S)-4-hydroxy-2-oxoglutarate aldolase
MHDVITQLRALRLIPIVVIDNADHAQTFGESLVAGGLPVTEVTFRTPAAEQAVQTLANRGDLLVGAGTILTIEHAKRAIGAGAQFIVAPGTNPATIEYVLKQSIPMMPGVATATEIQQASSLGATALKFFPAEAMGGTTTLKAFAGPFPDELFIPTGGITPEIVSHYLELKCVIACGGSWIAPREHLAAGRFDAIAASIKQAKNLLAGLPEIAT